MFPEGEELESRMKEFKRLKLEIAIILNDFIALEILGKTFGSKSGVTQEVPVQSSFLPDSDDGGKGEYELLKQKYPPDWESTIQAWLDSVLPAGRTFARASRRGAWRADVVLPGKKVKDEILNIILDTYHPVCEFLPSILGALAEICQANQLEYVRVVQCRDRVTADELIETSRLAAIDIRGHRPPEPPKPPEPRPTPRSVFRSEGSWASNEIGWFFSKSNIRWRARRHPSPVSPKQEPYIHLNIPTNAFPPRPGDSQRRTRKFGNDLSEAFQLLSEDANVTAVLVVTDGNNIGCPVEEPPYSVLWHIVGKLSPTFPWGNIVRFEMRISSIEC